MSYANSSIANLTEIKLKEFNAFERKFLQALDYKLGVEDGEIDAFIDKWTQNGKKLEKDREQFESVKCNVNRMRMMYERYELNRSQ